MFLIGVTGGIGAGKTVALGEFRGMGVRVLDADDVVHRLYARGTPVYRAVRERWGGRVTAGSGAIDRAAVARLVFASDEDLAWLTQLLHPLVKQAVLDETRRVRSGLFCGVPLLFEVGWDEMMSKTIAVWCDPRTQLRRLHERGWSDTGIRQRSAGQMGMDEKLARADFGIINTGSRSLLREQCRRVLTSIRTEAAERNEEL